MVAWGEEVCGVIAEGSGKVFSPEASVEPIEMDSSFARELESAGVNGGVCIGRVAGESLGDRPAEGER
jgi:repressor of nif and glnA expression